MVVNYCFNTFSATSTTIADSDTVSVKDPVEAVVLRKMPVK